MASRFDTQTPVHTIIDALTEAPAWARLGLAAPGPLLRERAIAKLASLVAQRIDDPVTPLSDDAGQLQLEL